MEHLEEYKKYKVWQVAHTLSEAIVSSNTTSIEGKYEDTNLQMKTIATFMPARIAEAISKQNAKEKLHLYESAIGCLYDLNFYLILLNTKLGDEYVTIQSKIDELRNMLMTCSASIRKEEKLMAEIFS